MSTASSPAPTASHSPLIANLIAQLAFGLLAMTICLPSMQEWAAMFGSDQASVQLTFSGYVVAYGGLQLVYGPLSDRLGRKKVLMFGLTLAGLGSVLAALSPAWPGSPRRVCCRARAARPAWWWAAPWCRTCSPAPSAPA